MATAMLNTQSLIDAKLHDEPFQWAHIRESFVSPQAVAELRRDFPVEGFGRKQRRLAESSVSGGHYLNGRGLVTRETGEIFRPDTLAPAWIALANDLLSDDYREAMSKLTGIDLEHTLLEAIVFRQPEGGYLDPHPDNPGKPVSQVFYFNDSWSAGNGGCLRILRSNDIGDVAEEFMPEAGTSVVLVRSDDSWHGYLPVEGDQTRLSLQIFFCRQDMKFATEYGPDWTKPPRITRPLRLDETDGD
jgi:SM-20-related protein